MCHYSAHCARDKEEHKGGILDMQGILSNRHVGHKSEDNIILKYILAFSDPSDPFSRTLNAQSN